MTPRSGCYLPHSERLLPASPSGSYGSYCDIPGVCLQEICSRTTGGKVCSGERQRSFNGASLAMPHEFRQSRRKERRRALSSSGRYSSFCVDGVSMLTRGVRGSRLHLRKALGRLRRYQWRLIRLPRMNSEYLRALFRFSKLATSWLYA